MQRLIDWFESRTGVMELLDDEVFSKKAPKMHRWYELFGCFGGLSLILFILQVLTGIFLLIYYVPSPAEAFSSVVFIDNGVVFGWLFRRLHAVGANIMILLVMIHMLKVIISGAYKAPREFHWLSGFALLMLTMMMGISGYLLPWTQLSYWAVTVLTTSFSVMPVVGPEMMKIIRGADTVGAATLGRFFALHLATPVLMLMLLAVHFMMIKKTGINETL
ncbi:MAG: cytochrome b N-terminal domain-containing protein [Geobacter sp.]|nr:cytochrome b N-terminal domain-containing protein [Geobacter sp.]